MLVDHGIRRAVNVFIGEGNAKFGVLEADCIERGAFDNYDTELAAGAWANAEVVSARQDGRGLRLTVLVDGRGLEATPAAGWLAPTRGEACRVAPLAARVFPA